MAAPTIVLIDYDEAVLAANSEALQSRGYQVHTASDGAEGLKAAVEQRPGIVVLDLVLQRMPGLQVCEAIKKNPQLGHTKVIVAPSPTFHIDLKKARNLGAVSFLNKPYQPEDLVRAIASVEAMPLPDNEAKRIATLHGYNILDSAPEKTFDDLAKLAAIICDVPGAMITFIDSERQWFKSNIGFMANDVPREMSFCAHAIMHEEVMVVEDAEKDERFAGNPLVTSGPQIRFYAGSPLMAPTGEALGTVCVIDHKPRVINENQKTALKLLSNQVQVLLEWRRYLIRAKGSSASG